MPWALVKARTIQRGSSRKGTEDRTTTYDWLVDIRAFFCDLCNWGTEPGSPLIEHMPPAIPLTSHDLNSGRFAAARARTTARQTSTVMDLTREIPNIRAFALRVERRWHEAGQHLAATPESHAGQRHVSLDTVLIYAKLYPDTLIDGYRTAMRGLYTDIYDTDALRAPTAEEWATFAAGCNLRDMGTHICALPTGEYCSRGLVCLGCHHAQPKKSAAPVFRRMIASHPRALARAHESGEPTGQIAARELEIERLRSALSRADELTGESGDRVGVSNLSHQVRSSAASGR